MMLREVPDHIRLDNGPESTARVVREWVDRVGARMLYIEPRSPWENGYIESFSGKLRDELLDREIFYTLLEVRVLTERYWRAYNQVRPHSSPGSSSLVMVGIGAPEVATEVRVDPDLARLAGGETDSQDRIGSVGEAHTRAVVKVLALLEVVFQALEA